MTSLTEPQEPARRAGRGACRRILAAAAELFYFEGINATGVDLIANKASVSKRTLYQHFPSKATLVEEYLRQLRQKGGEGEGKSAQTPESTPRARLLALFELADAGGGRMRGCPFHNAAVEAAGVMPGVEHIVHLHKRDYVDGVTELARGRSGGPGNAGQPDRTALRRRICNVHVAERRGAVGAGPGDGRGADRRSNEPLALT